MIDLAKIDADAVDIRSKWLFLIKKFFLIELLQFSKIGKNNPDQIRWDPIDLLTPLKNAYLKPFSFIKCIINSKAFLSGRQL